MKLLVVANNMGYTGCMNSNVKIRESLPGDADGIEQLYGDAFPDEDLLPIVRELLDLEKGVISLVATIEKSIIGHISFTICGVEGGTVKVALLAPLAVTPSRQKQGIGGTLIKTGFKLLENSKTGYAFVLGDPAYYGRFGFNREDKVTTPYPLPLEWRDAWQSIKLSDSDAPQEGRLSVPEPWRHLELWTS